MARVDDFIKTANNSQLSFPKIVRFKGDPEDILDSIEYLGNTEPEELAGFIRKLAKRIKRRIRARRKRRKKRPSRYSLTAPEGTATVSPEGITFTKAGAIPPTMPGLMPTAPAGIAGLLKNPMMLMIPAGIMLMMIMKKRKK